MSTQGHDHDDEIELSAHEAVLLSPGAELRSSAKVGLGLIVLASALLGVFILQRSHATLRSLPSVHSTSPSVAAAVPTAADPPADGKPVEHEQSTQAATAAPLQYNDSLPTANAASPQRAASEAQAASAPAKESSHAPTRHTSTTRSEPGLEAFVEVSVRTVPRGASVAVLGSDARCEPTPCALLVPKDRAVTLRAEARNTSVQKTFTFGEESEVELRLSGRKPTNTSTPDGVGSAVTSKPVLPPHAPSDLKVPSIFRDR